MHELLAQIYADPAADAPRLVYADWLIEQGDPLGELITMQIARATRAARTQTRERALLEANESRWWHDHPCRPFRPLAWEDLARGFPVRFRPGWSAETAVAVVATATNPGWSTVEELDFPFQGFSSPGLAMFLRTANLTSLRTLTNVHQDVLALVADLGLGVSELELWASRELTEVSGFPKLARLTVYVKESPARALARLEPTELLPRIEYLLLRGVTTPVSIKEALETFALLPPSIQTLQLDRYSGARLFVSGSRVRASITASDVGPIIEELATIDEHAIASLELEFAKGGFFTKKTRPLLAARIEAATRRWGTRVSLDVR